MTTAAYNAQRDAFGRTVVWCVELVLDRCTLLYGPSAGGGCGVASDLGDGSRCYYTFGTCQLPSAFNRGTRTLRFHSNGRWWPDAANPSLPLLKRFVAVPQRIDGKSLAVFPEKISVEFLPDWTPPPQDHDKGTNRYNTTRAGEFWRNLIARSRNYPGRTLRIRRGFAAEGFTLADFEQLGPNYRLKDIQVEDGTGRGDPGKVTITAEAPLVDLSKRSVPWTIADDNVLQVEPVVRATESKTVPAGSPYTVTVDHAGTFYRDLGVYDNTAGAALVAVTGTLAAGQYKVNAGVYTFHSSAASHSVSITYDHSPGTGGTTLYVKDASEFPDPASYSRSGVYVECESEIMRVTARDPAANALTVDRARWGTAAAAHASGTVVRHVLCIGTDNGATAPNGRNAIEIIRDLYEWAGIASADVDGDSHDLIKATVWPDDDCRAVLRRPKTVAACIQNLREARGIITYINNAGKFACQALAPTVTPIAALTDANLTHCKVKDDEESRITRVWLWYDPITDNPSAPKDYRMGAVAPDASLEVPNSYGDVRPKVFLDPFLDPSYPLAKIRTVARRTVTRLRAGLRTYAFGVELRDATFREGDQIELTTRQVMTIDGRPARAVLLVIAKSEVTENEVEYEAIDLGYGGRYLRIAPDGATEPWDSMTDAEKLLGAWGDSDNRLGARKEIGCLIW